MSIDVLRGGESSKAYSGLGWDASIATNDTDSPVRIGFKISSSGGNTDVLVRITSDSFYELAQAMMRADAKEAIRAFGEALKGYR